MIVPWTKHMTATRTLNSAYFVGFRGHRKLTAIHGKFAAVSSGIWQTGMGNLEKFAAENCGPYILPVITSISRHNDTSCKHSTFNTIQ